MERRFAASVLTALALTQLFLTGLALLSVALRSGTLGGQGEVYSLLSAVFGGTT